jgi:hypothetical protein
VQGWLGYGGGHETSIASEEDTCNRNAGAAGFGW